MAVKCIQVSGEVSEVWDELIADVLEIRMLSLRLSDLTRHGELIPKDLDLFYSSLRQISCYFNQYSDGIDLNLRKMVEFRSSVQFEKVS